MIEANKLSTIKDVRNNQLFFRLCSDHLSVEAIPKRPLKIDLMDAKTHLEQEYRLLMFTPHFVVLGRDGEEITLRNNGRMIIRKASSEQDARSAGVKLLQYLASMDPTN